MKINFMDLGIFSDDRNVRKNIMVSNRRECNTLFTEQEYDYIESQIESNNLEYEIKDYYNPKEYYSKCKLCYFLENKNRLGEANKTLEEIIEESGLLMINEKETIKFTNDDYKNEKGKLIDASLAEDANAEYYLSLLLKCEKNIDDSRVLLIDSAIKGCPLAQYDLSTIYYLFDKEDSPLFPGKDMAAFWMLMAGKNGYLEALYKFAGNLEYGSYGPINNKKIIDELWLYIAEKGHKKAQTGVVRVRLMSNDSSVVEKGLELANRYKAGNIEVQNLLSNYMRNKK